jgi:hypothetical protein
LCDGGCLCRRVVLVVHVPELVERGQLLLLRLAAMAFYEFGASGANIKIRIKNWVSLSIFYFTQIIKMLM